MTIDSNNRDAALQPHRHHYVPNLRMLNFPQQYAGARVPKHQQNLITRQGAQSIQHVARVEAYR